MKLFPFQLSIAPGLAFAIGFLICNIIFLIGGRGFSLDMMNLISHETNFKPILAESGFNLVNYQEVWESFFLPESSSDILLHLFTMV